MLFWKETERNNDTRNVTTATVLQSEGQKEFVRLCNVFSNYTMGEDDRCLINHERGLTGTDFLLFKHFFFLSLMKKNDNQIVKLFVL